MIKERTGRVRYILFQVTGGRASRRQINERLKLAVPCHPPRLTVYNGGYGIVKCRHYQKDDIITFLQSLDWVGHEENKIKIKTIKTSGTIKTLKTFF